MNNYFVYVLSVAPNLYTKILSTFFTMNNINFAIVSDKPYSGKDTNIIHYPDEQLIAENFYHFEKVKHGQPSAWDKALYHIKNSEIKYDYYYFMEEDVFCSNIDVFIQFFKCLEHREGDLLHHTICDGKRKGWVMHLYKGINDKKVLQSQQQICRVSKKLLDKIFEFYNENHYLYFHEIMLPTICFTHDLTMIDYLKDEELKKFFGTFIWRPVLPLCRCDLITHPVKAYTQSSGQNRTDISTVRE